MKVRRAMLVAVGVAAIALTGCGGSGGSSSGSRDSFGDPYISNAQGRALTVGMGASAAFQALGGKADSGDNGSQALPPKSYDYPVRGTGNPDDPNDTKTIWWQICVKDGRVVGKVHGHLDSLPTRC